MTQKSKWNKRSKKYLNYMGALQDMTCKQFDKETIPKGKPIEVDIVFYMPLPASTKDNKRTKHRTIQIGTPHIKKPDIDNLVKGVFDALNKYAWHDDNQVYKQSAIKINADKPSIKVIIREGAT